MKKRTAYIILSAIIVALLVLSFFGRHENSSKSSADHNLQTEGTQVSQESTEEYKDQSEGQEEIIIASGGEESATDLDAMEADEIEKMIEKGKEYHENKTETYDNVTFENMDIFTERSCDIKEMYNSIKNYLYGERDERIVKKCVFSRETNKEGAVKRAVLYFEDGTSRQITVCWHYYQYLIQTYEEHSPEDFDASIDNPVP